VRNMAGIVSGDEAPVAESVANPEKTDAWSSVAFGFLFVFGWFILFSCLASGRQNHWLPWLIFTRSYRNSHRPTGSGPGGSFRSGSGTGGGFRGGGGRFGGGGASGGW
ncbi:MAG: hypothetical protein K2H09_07755, partial [Treponemataceae bacterium]|nr:hypothetical protein [Treponemataceae bacterium]